MYLITEQGPNTILHTSGYVTSIKQVAKYVSNKILEYEKLKPGTDEYKKVRDEVMTAIQKTKESQFYNHELLNAKTSYNKDTRKVDGRYYQFVITRINKL